MASRLEMRVTKLATSAASKTSMSALVSRFSYNGMIPNKESLEALILAIGCSTEIKDKKARIACLKLYGEIAGFYRTNNKAEAVRSNRVFILPSHKQQ